MCHSGAEKNQFKDRLFVYWCACTRGMPDFIEVLKCEVIVEENPKGRKWSSLVDTYRKRILANYKCWRANNDNTWLSVSRFTETLVCWKQWKRETGVWSMEALALIGMETDPLEEAAVCNVV